MVLPDAALRHAPAEAVAAIARFVGIPHDAPPTLSMRHQRIPTPTALATKGQAASGALAQPASWAAVTSDLLHDV